MEIHILLAGAQIGPFSEKQVRQHLKEGLVSASDPAKHAGMKEWETVDTVLAKLAAMPETPSVPEPKIEVKTEPPSIAVVPEKSKEETEKPKTMTGSLEASRPVRAESEDPFSIKPLTVTSSLAKIKRKPGKIVLQPIQPLATAGAPEKKEAGATTGITLSSATSPARATTVPTAATSTPDKTPAATTPPVNSSAPAPTKPAPDKKKSPPLSERINPAAIYVTAGLCALLLLITICSLIFSSWKKTPASASNQPSHVSDNVPPQDDAQVLASNPKTPNDFCQRGFARQGKGDYDGAIADYNAALGLDSKYVLAYYERGLAEQAKGDLDKAISDYSRAIELDPKNIQSFYHRGLARQTKNSFDDALADFNQTLALDPNHAEAFSCRAFVKQSTGDPDGALADYTQALLINPKIAWDYQNRGLIREKKGDLNGAISDYNHALDIDPTMANTYYNRGHAKNVSGNLDGAVADFTQALAINPKMTPAYRDRAVIRQGQGDLDGALSDYTKALALDPKLGGAYSARGLIKEQKNDLDGAIEDCTQALALNPKDALSYCNRGLARLGKGDLDGAMGDLKAFCEHAPQDSNVDYVRLYLWVIETQLNPRGSADSDLADALSNEWNSPPEDFTSRIAKFLLGRINEGDLIVSATSSDPLANNGLHCKAWYFAGMKRLLAGDMKTAGDYFHRSMATGQKNSCEYIFAQAELKTLGQNAAVSSNQDPQ